MDQITTIEKIKKLKNASGSHSPSIETILQECPEINVKIDACFLSNPYATDLFLDYFKKDLIDSGRFKDVLEYYPPQNREVAKAISKAINIDQKCIFVGNGAIEIIQAVIQKFVLGKICVIIPTFSSYYEFVEEQTEVVYYSLSKDDNFNLDIEHYIKFIRDNNCKSIVLINPNNPNGGYILKDDILKILNEFKELENIIIDESFIHFAFEDVELSQVTTEDLINSYPNLIVIKSMSKDFGIAGIRSGYAIMAENKVNNLLSNGYLWNVSGLSNYFYNLYANPEFLKEYNVARKKYIMNTLMFISELMNVDKAKIYPSKANFVLLELQNGMTSFEFTMRLLLDYGVYIRDCSDKIGLNGQFLRIASRSFEENLIIINSIKDLLKEKPSVAFNVNSTEICQ